MTIVHSSRQASVDEIAAEMDRRGTVIERIEAERNLFKGKYRSIIVLLDDARQTVQNVVDHVEDEGDRSYFGSTNHADRLRDLVEDMDGWSFDAMLPKGDLNKMERDPYAALREQRQALAAKEAEIAKLREALEPFAKIARIVLSEAPADADYCSLYQDCEGVSHRVTMDECRALVKAGEA